MTSNRIKKYREASQLSQKALGRIITNDDCSDSFCNMLMSIIENGRALPTKPMMDSMCTALSCTPTDLYAPEDLYIYQTVVTAPDETGLDGGGRTDGAKIIFKATKAEKDSLQTACKKMGYRSTTEWFREQVRNLLKQCALVGLDVTDKNSIEKLTSVIVIK